MGNVIHLLNGDALAERFPLDAIGGETLIWREILSEGPVSSDFDEEFVQSRADWLEQQFSRWFDDLPDYHDKVAPTFARLQSLPADTSIVLWFEDDLFCQLNLLGAISLLQQAETNGLKLLQPQFAEGPVFSFAALSNEEMLAAAKAAKPISEALIGHAQAVWEAFTSESPKVLVSQIDMIADEMPGLAEAMRHHIERFPSLYDGLNQEERTLLRLIHETRPETIGRLIHTFLLATPELGFGDLQVWRLIHRLSPALVLFDQNTPPDLLSPENMTTPVKIELTKLARRIMHRKSNWLNFHDFDRWLGGVHLTRRRNMYYWDAEEGVFV